MTDKQFGAWLVLVVIALVLVVAALIATSPGKPQDAIKSLVKPVGYTQATGNGAFACRSRQFSQTPADEYRSDGPVVYNRFKFQAGSPVVGRCLGINSETKNQAQPPN